MDVQRRHIATDRAVNEGLDHLHGGALGAWGSAVVVGQVRRVGVFDDVEATGLQPWPQVLEAGGDVFAAVLDQIGTPDIDIEPRDFRDPVKVRIRGLPAMCPLGK